MESQSQAQWVVRLPDRLIQLQRPLQAIRVFSTAEVLQFKTYYNSGNSKVRIERQHDSNERQADVPFAYWVVLVPTGAAADPAIEVLCCTVQRETADRILDSLWMSLFTNCGDNTFVDLRQLLAADRITPEMVAAAPAVGRFVDLDDGEYRRPVAAVVSVADAAIPVEIIPAHANTPRNVSNTDWRYAAGAGVPARLLVQSQQDIGVEIVTSILGGESQIRSGQQVQAAAMSPVIDAVRTAAEDSGVVQNIGRGRSIADVRLELERHAAVQRQWPENRNTEPLGRPGPVVSNRDPESGNYTRDGIWRTASARMLQRDGADTPAATLADRDARRRANPMLGLDE